MQGFMTRHDANVVGALHGFDRVLFRGTLRSISYLSGMDAWLASQRVLYKNFGTFAEAISKQVRDHARQFAEKHGRPYEYLASAGVSKEDVARDIMQRDNIERGLVCVLGCVELCKSFTIRKNRDEKKLNLVAANRKCLFLYFYFVDREFGLMHIRLQTWLPMPIQVCLNGREYLARRLDRAGIGYEKVGNCFTRIDDLKAAQRMMDDLEKRNWCSFLNALARRVNPWMHSSNPLDLHGYYWTLRESEYATDVMFRDDASLAAIYPALVSHAISQFDCHNVMRFLGRRTNVLFSGEASSNVKHRTEGVRVKHWVEENSIKMYDKAGSVLRIETTMNNPRRFKVRRRATRKGQSVLAWIPLRKSVADITRRVDICRAANERYLEALGVVGEPSPTHQLLDPVSKRIVRRGRSYRALRPIDPVEAKLFAALLDGEFLLHGFRNKDLRCRIYPRARTDDDRRRASGRITRMLRLLRAHGLIRKVSHTFNYRVTSKGQRLMTTSLKLRRTSFLALAA